MVDTRAVARAYMARGWAVFLLSRDDSGGKIPVRNCTRCDPRTGTYHDKETCICVTCHGFYAATHSEEVFDAMMQRVPGELLAIRTGSASRLLIIDAEATADEGSQETGLEVLDDIEQWTNGVALPPTLTARSVSGGLHLYFELPEGLRLPGINRVLPGVDIKCEGGYVGAVGSATGKRAWVDPAVGVARAPDALLKWLGSRRTLKGMSNGGGGSAPGYSFLEFAREGCPGGQRDYFFNELLFRLRKRGVSVGDATSEAYRHWTRVAQPPDARTYCAWEHIVYKIERVWNEVAPDADVSGAQALLQRWQENMRSSDEPRKIGRVTVVRRGRR